MATTCPYCNAIVPAQAAQADRVTCHRCGETFRPDRSRSLNEIPSLPVETKAARPPGRGARWWAPVGLAVLVVAVGLTWSAWKRSHRGQSPVATSVARQHVVVPPGEMPGLGYLPGSTEAILAVQVPALVERLGPEAGADPDGALRYLGIPDAIRETIEKVSGVGLRNVDQLVVGLGFEKGSLPPQIIVVVQTREPYSLPALAKHTKARTLKKNGRTLQVANAAPIPEVYWWGPSDRILIGTIAARDFDQVPHAPRPGTAHLRTDLTRQMRERVAEDACGWMVATSDKWDEYLVPYTILPGNPLSGRRDMVAAANRLHGVSLSVPADPGRPAELYIERKSPAAGEELRGALGERFAGSETEVAGEAETCVLRTKLDPGALEALIGKLLAPPAK